MSLINHHVGRLWQLRECLLGLLLLTGLRVQATTTCAYDLKGWQNVSQTWGGTLTENNSRLAEGDLVNLRCVATLAAGASSTVNLRYDFTTGNGSTRFFDYLTSATLPNSTLLSGTGLSGNPTQERLLPRDSGVPLQSSGSLRIWGATVTGFGPYTLVNGVKVLPVTVAVPAGGRTRTVVIAYAAHLAREQDYAPFRGTGAATFPGASRKAYANVNGGSYANVSVNAGALAPTVDLVVSQVASPAPALVGAPISFTITVSNPSAYSATGVVLQHTAPAGAQITSSQGTMSGSTVTLGAIAAGQQATVTVRVTAPCGAIANTATVTSATLDPVLANNTVTTQVTPVDNTPPMIAGPADLTQNNDPGVCGAVVTYVPPVGTDNCPGVTTVLKAGLASGSVFPVGTTTVIYEATDAAGNKSSCSFTVTVADTEPPTLSGVPAEPVIAFAAPTTCGTVVELPVVTVSDSCAPAQALAGVRSDGLDPAAPFPLGTTHVSYTAADAAGNVASAAFDVVVVPLNLAWPVATRLLLPEPDPGTGLTGVNLEECIGLPSQSRWYKFKVQPNSKLLVTLDHLPENYDVVLYKDIQQVYDELTQAQTTGDLTQLNAEFAADAFSGAAFSTEAFAGAAFSGAAFSTEDFAGAAWSGAAFSAAAFSGAAWSPDVYAPDTFFGAAFSGAAFSGAAFSEAASAGAAFSGAAFSGAAFSGAAWSGAAWSGAAWSGAAWSGAAFSGAAFSTEAVSGAAWSGAAFSGAAFSDAQQRSIIGVSAFPGIGDEAILANTWDHDRDFYIRVRGRNGAFAPGQNYRLGVHMLTGACNNLTPVEALPASSTPVPETGAIKTLILTDPARLARFSGTPDSVAALGGRLANFATRPEIAGVVIDLGQDARVAAANLQADARLACPSAKNLVAASIRDLVMRYRALHPEIEYLVLVGNDAVIPFFRHSDQGLLANENNYIPPVLNTSSSEAALKLGYFLTQDAYASACDLSLRVGSLPLPDLGLGRLVETPAEIAALLDAYESLENGIVPTPTTALATGYDFLTDAADAITSEFQTALGHPVDTLIQPSGQLPAEGWNADQLRSKLLDSRHDLIFLGGHFSAVGALAADYQTRITAAQLEASSVDLVNAIVFSAGCHSGYNIVNTDGVPQVTEEPDWAQAFARKGATLVAGTGYQYGDTDIIEYSERLYVNFARQLRSGSGPVAVGKALAKAKALYLAETPFMRGLHEKALLQATLFGLPMLRVDVPGGRGALPSDTSIVATTGGVPLSPAPAPGQVFGLQVAEVSLNPTLTAYTSELKDVDAGGDATVTATYFAAANGVVANPSEPIFPLEVRNVTVAGQVLRGVGFRSAVYADEEELRPLTSAAATELSGVHTPFLSDTFFPIRFWNVNYFDALCESSEIGSGATRLFVVPAQFISQEPGSPLGTFRKFSALDFRLYYNNNTTTYTVIEGGNPGTITPSVSAAPSFVQVSEQIDTANSTAQSVTFRVRVVGNPFAGIQEVWVTYTGVKGTPGFYGRWQSLNLAQPDPANDSTLWEGTLPTGGVRPGDLRYVVQAANGLGLVSLSTKLGAYYIPGEVETLPTVATTLTLDPPNLASEPPVNPAAAQYAQKVRFRATLTAAGGTPVPGQVIAFALGSQEARATTDASGVAQVIVPVLGFPGEYDLRVAFGGDNAFKPSAAAVPFTIAKQATALTLDPGAGTYYVQAGLQTPFIATLAANGQELPERTVFFTFASPTQGTYYFPVITDFAGRALLPPLPVGAVPDGVYEFSVYFGSGIPGQPINASDPRYIDATTAGTVIVTTVVVNDPSGAIQFPGDILLNTSADGIGDCLARLELEGLTTVEESIAGFVTVSYAIAGNPVASPHAFPVGATVVNASAAINNTLVTSGSFEVIVTDDESPTVATQPATVYLEANGQARVDPAAVFAGGTDNCGAVAPVRVEPSDFSCANLGLNAVTLTVSDGHGNTATGAAVVTVVDNLAPTAICRTATAAIDPTTGQLTVRAADIDGGSADSCGLAAVEIGKGALPVTAATFGGQVTFGAAETGTRAVTLRATDTSGNQSTCTTTVTVPDVLPPVGTVAACPARLETPNHKLKTVLLTVHANDPDARLLRYRIACVSSDERLNGTGDGDASPDWIFASGPNPVVTETLVPAYSISSCVRDPAYGWSAPGNNVLSLQLRSERAQNGDGRVYTIRVEIRDPAGNIGVATGQVSVPK